MTSKNENQHIPGDSSLYESIIDKTTSFHEHKHETRKAPEPDLPEAPNPETLEAPEPELPKASEPETLDAPEMVITKKQTSARYLIIGLAILALALGIFDVIQYTKQTEMDAIILSLQDEITSQKKTIADKDNTITKQAKTVSAYETIVKAVNSGSFFSSASNFYVDDYIVCLKPGQQKKIPLVANWPDYGYVSIETSSNKAYISFDEDSWSYGTTITVGAKSSISDLPYVNIFTFSNDVDNNTFKVLAIITE